MAGRATLITDASMDAILEPRMVAASTQRLACEAQPGVSGAPRMTPVSHGGCATLSMRDQQRSQPDEPRRDPEPLGAGAAEHRDRYAGSNQRARFGPPSRLRADASPSVLGGLVDRTPLTDPPERLIDHVSGSHGWRDWVFRSCSRYRTLAPTCGEADAGRIHVVLTRWGLQSRTWWPRSRMQAWNACLNFSSALKPS